MKEFKVLLDDEPEYLSTLAERLKLREIQARTARTARRLFLR
jgi:exoribonuclease II